MVMNFDHRLFRSIAAQVEKEYQMGGLSHGLYCDFAHDCAMRYAAAKLGETGAAQVEHPTVEVVQPAEKAALEYLWKAWNAFQALPAQRQRESDKDEFAHAIHAAQNIIYTRLALRVLGVWFGEDA